MEHGRRLSATRASKYRTTAQASSPAPPRRKPRSPSDRPMATDQRAFDPERRRSATGRQARTASATVTAPSGDGEAHCSAARRSCCHSSPRDRAVHRGHRQAQASARWPARRPRPTRRATRSARSRWRAAARCRHRPATRCCRKTRSSCASACSAKMAIAETRLAVSHRDVWCESTHAISGRTTAIQAAQRHAVESARTARPTDDHRRGNQVDPDGHAVRFEDAERDDVVEQRAGWPARSTRGDASRGARVARAGSAGTGRRRA